jgi:hypothetical protein
MTKPRNKRGKVKTAPKTKASKRTDTVKEFELRAEQVLAMNETIVTPVDKLIAAGASFSEVMLQIVDLTPKELKLELIALQVHHVEFTGHADALVRHSEGPNRSNLERHFRALAINGNAAYGNVRAIDLSDQLISASLYLAYALTEFGAKSNTISKFISELVSELELDGQIKIPQPYHNETLEPSSSYQKDGSEPLEDTVVQN